KFGTATVTITAEDTFDYAEATKTVTVTVNKKKISLPTVDGIEYTYTGTAQTYGVTSTDDYTVEGGTQTNAGEYPVTITLNNDNYEWDGTLGTYKFVINKAAVTVTAKSYTIKVGEALPSYAYDVTGLVNVETLPIDVTISCTADGKTAGTFDIVVSGDAASDNYTFAYVDGTLTVTTKNVQTITASDVTLTYGDTDGRITATANGSISYDVATGADVISVDENGNITILKFGTATVTITAEDTFDYAEATKTISVTVNKKKIAVPADTTEYTYTGTAQTYGVVSTADYTVEGGVQTNAGEYPVTITLNNENYEWDGTLGTYTFVIKQVPVTVTAKSYTIKVGDTLPTYAYDVAGLVNGEALPIDVTISCTADGKTAGTFDIVVSGDTESKNYKFSYVNGTLTVSEKEVVAAPTFTPASGTVFSSSLKITIACATEGAKIYYTTDGTAPTTASTLYNGAITVTATTTVKAIAVKDGMTNSIAVTAVYTRKSSGSSGGGGYTPSRPSTPTNPEINGKSAGWTTIASDIENLTAGGETTIELNGNYDVPVDVMKAIADKDIKVTFVVDSTRSWIIDGAEIRIPAAVDLSILTVASLNTGTLRGDVGTRFRIDGTNAPTELCVTMNKKHAGKFANLYMKKENELVFVDNVKVDENGKAVLSVSEKGDYVIMLCEYSDRKGDVSNDGVTNAMDASAILKDIVELEVGANPVMLDYNGDGKVNALDASSILIDIVNGRIQ
ncbi:MAG: chitobiase/beta-hexosaminidase C-terminal domain-containing protein, partial [Ruminococcus sp.]|nr:chitobiase/beta-hexosaminidase C-terminal domain-containing protein [Ruminococcus sp.]